LKLLLLAIWGEVCSFRESKIIKKLSSRQFKNVILEISVVTIPPLSSMQQADKKRAGNPVTAL
jgi:hypothetical protein